MTTDININCYLRLCQVIGTEAARQGKKPINEDKTVYEPIIPVSKTTWYAGIRSGIYPAPIKLSKGCAVWRSKDILALITGQIKVYLPGSQD